MNRTSMSKIAMAAMLALPLVACTQGSSLEDSNQVRAPEVRVVGEAVNCVDTRRIAHTRVHDDYTIDFEMVGGTTYRNTLPNRCGGLRAEQSFTYDLRGTSNLCSTDVIHVLENDQRIGAGCGLGRFVPVELAARP
jgi:hypothetical protein